MYTIGKLVDGQFKQVAGNFDILNTPNATETSAGLMSANDKKTLDNSYTSKDVANEIEILSIFNK